MKMTTENMSFRPHYPSFLPSIWVAFLPLLPPVHLRTIKTISLSDGTTTPHCQKLWGVEKGKKMLPCNAFFYAASSASSVFVRAKLRNSISSLGQISPWFPDIRNEYYITQYWAPRSIEIWIFWPPGNSTTCVLHISSCRVLSIDNLRVSDSINRTIGINYLKAWYPVMSECN